MKKTVVLVDGMNLVHKSAYTYGQLRTKGGESSGAVYGVLSQIFSLQRKLKDEHKIVVFWEGVAPKPGTKVKSWREQLIAKTYKAGRVRNEDAIAAIAQVPSIIEGISILRHPQLYVPGLEADDLIGMAAAKLDADDSVSKVIIFSSDRDFLQCITDKVVVYRSLRGTIEKYTQKAVKSEFGIPPRLFANYKALIGDPSDNYKGAAGVGPIKARDMILAGVRPSYRKWDSHSDEVKEKFKMLEKQWDAIHNCYKLAAIPKTYKHKLLPTELQDAAKKELRVMHDTLFSKQSGQSKSALTRWSQFCARFELTTFLANRRQILEHLS